MALSSLFSVQCPVCANDIVFYRVKRRFNCATCASTLGSNRTTLDVWAALIYVLLVPAVWLLAGLQLGSTDAASYVEWAALTAAIGVVAYCMLAPQLLWLQTDTWSHGEKVRRARRRKVVDLRIDADADPHAGARKRSS